MTTYLVTGGVRCGKSAWAEAQFADECVTYITPGYPVDAAADPAWAARVSAHQARRPNTWKTVETVSVGAAITSACGPVLVDCLGTWVARVLDALDAWDNPTQNWITDFDAAANELARAIQNATVSGKHLVIVTNEVGWGVIPETRSGRIFADQLGRVNQLVASVVDNVVLLVAGRPVIL